VVLADGDGQLVVTVHAQGPVLRIVGEDDAVGAQPIDQVRSLRRGGDADPARGGRRPAAGKEDG
jgi:hypothetical protein